MKDVDARGQPATTPRTGSTVTSKRVKRWVIRVTFANGAVAYLRHGPVNGMGAIVKFRSRKDAELNAEAMIRPGLDDGDVVTVEREVVCGA